MKLAFNEGIRKFIEEMRRFCFREAIFYDFYEKMRPKIPHMKVENSLTFFHPLNQL